ncbi:MAG: hypothetical protein ABR575_10905 [Actinomycetota bacterium]
MTPTGRAQCLLLSGAISALLLTSACGSPPVPGLDPQAGGAPDVAEVVCEPGGVTRIETPEVTAQRDGVHFHIINRTGIHAGFSFEDPAGGGGGENAPADDGILVIPLSPGTARVGCPDHDAERPSDTLEPIEVIDEQGFFVEDTLDCAGGMGVSGSGSFAPDARGEKGDPVEIARDQLANRLRPDDELRRAGYVTEDEATVAVVRDGETVAVVHFFDDGYGGWLQDAMDNCENF